MWIFFLYSFSNKQLLCRCVFLTSQLLKWKSGIHWERRIFFCCLIWFWNHCTLSIHDTVNTWTHFFFLFSGTWCCGLYFIMTSLDSWLTEVLPHSLFIEAGRCDYQLNPLSTQNLEPGVTSPELKSAPLQGHLLYVSPESVVLKCTE